VFCELISILKAQEHANTSWNPTQEPRVQSHNLHNNLFWDISSWAWQHFIHAANLGGLEQSHLRLLVDMKKAPKLVVITAEFEGRVAVFVEDFEPSR
jgi:hypothetical protein